MADKRKTIEIVVDAKTGKAKKGLRDVNTAADKTGKAGTSLGAKMKAGLAMIPAGAVVAAAAFAAIFSALKKGMALAKEFELVMAQFEVRAGTSAQQTAKVKNEVKALAVALGGGDLKAYFTGLRSLQDAGLGVEESLIALKKAGMNAVIGNGSIPDLTAQVQKLAPTARQLNIENSELVETLSIAADAYGKLRTAGARYNTFLTNLKDETNLALVTEKGLVGAIRDAKFNLDDFTASPEALGFISVLRDDTSDLADKFERVAETSAVVNDRIKNYRDAVLEVVGEDVQPLWNDLLLAATLYMSRYTKILRVFGKEAEDAFDPSVGPEELAALYGDAAEAIVGTVLPVEDAGTAIVEAEERTTSQLQATLDFRARLRKMDVEGQIAQGLELEQGLRGLDEAAIARALERLEWEDEIEEGRAERAEISGQRRLDAERAFMDAALSLQSKSAKDAANIARDTLLNALKMRLLDAVTGAVSKTLASVPFPLNIVLAAVAGAATTLAFNAVASRVPSFRGGVTNFGGGYAQLHQDEIVQLPRGSNVVSQARSRNIADTLAGQGGMSGTIKVQIKADVPFVMDKMQFESERNGRTGAGPVIMFEQ